MIAVNEAIILTDSGNENWGSISANMIQGADKNLGLKELPIRLYKGNQGFGLVHIANHLGDFTFSDISKEIENLFSKPNKIYARRYGNAVKLEIFPKPPALWGILELHEDKDCYSIISFYPRQNKNSKAKGRLIWEYGSQAVSSQAASELSRNGANSKMLQIAQEEMTAKPRDIVSQFFEKSSSINKNNDIKFSLTPPVESENFKRWFGDSKVVDSAGKPLVVYHGSPNYGFTVFDKNRVGERDRGDFGKGFYFTPSKSYAASYTEEGYWNSGGDESKVYACYISMKNPLIVNSRSHVVMEGQYRGLPVSEYMFDEGYDGVIAKLSPFDTGRDDGIWKINEIVVFDSTQIKSATDNNGSYDPNNPDIRYSLAEK